MPRLKHDDALLGTNRAAEYLSVHRSTLTSWRLRGEITPTAVAQTPLEAPLQVQQGRPRRVP